MGGLTLQKKLAADILKVGETRVVMDPEHLEDIKNAITRADIRNRRIGFVFQSYNLLARCNALENVELPMLYRRPGEQDRRRKAMEALEMVEMEDRALHLPQQLSGGQQQRVAIARAIVNNPALILADEPTGNLDTRTGREVMKLLASFHKEGITVILVTHDPEVARVARRKIVLRDGLMESDEVP